MPSLFIFAKIQPKPEHLVEARAAIKGVIPQTLSEDGCLQFRLHDGLGDGCLYLYEEWVDGDALAQHYAQPYIAEVFAAYEAWLVAPVEISKMELIS